VDIPDKALGIDNIRDERRLELQDEERRSPHCRVRSGIIARRRACPGNGRHIARPG
jgi:hypothetical protein